MSKIDPHASARSRSGALTFSKPSKTVRSQAYETDINNMVKGLTPFTQSRRPGFFIDETILPQNYEAQFNAVLAAQNAFMQLPPDIREEFHNDPAELSRALGNPAAQKRLQELGIVPSATTPTPAKPEGPLGPSVASDEATHKSTPDKGSSVEAPAGASKGR